MREGGKEGEGRRNREGGIERGAENALYHPVKRGPLNTTL